MNHLIKNSFFLGLIFLTFSTQKINAQSDDSVLFTVDKTDVTVGEFKYIYEKNNGDKADYSKESIKEYLDLYTKFKLKVQKAKELQLDTVVALKEELAGYRKQLASSYLVDKELSNLLMNEVYERMQKDIRVSHILFIVDEKARDEETENTFTRAEKAKGKLEQGASFDMMAKTLSEDTGSGSRGGDLGWVTAMLPDGYYELENAIYNADKDVVYGPIKTKVGYHIVKVTDIRDARGEMEIGQILIRDKKKGKTVENAKAKIDSVHQLLVNGENFEELAKSLSDDKITAQKGGYLGYFGIGQYQENFENAAFSIKNDGDFSNPIKSSIGWHIIKRINTRDLKDEAKVKRLVQSKITKDSRYNIARQALMSSIQKEGGFTEDLNLLKVLTNKLDAEFYTHRWVAPELPNSKLISFGSDVKYTLPEFSKFIEKNIRKRLRFDKRTPFDVAVKALYQTYKNEKTILYEEANLEKKYPEFESLMREYSEGILLFEITNQKVWNLASKDTVGLNEFYARNQNTYYWKERAKLDVYDILSKEKKIIKKAKKLIKDTNPENVMSLFGNNSQMCNYSQNTYDVGAKEFLNLDWKVGSMYVDDSKENRTLIKKIVEILPTKPKSFGEAKGYIIADYQDELEKKWLNKLKKEYPIKINDAVLNQMTKK